MEKYERPVVEVMEIEDDVLADTETPEIPIPSGNTSGNSGPSDS